MRFYATTATTEDNKHTTVSARKNIIFSSQRFYGLEKKLEKKYNCARSKNVNVFITALLWTNNKGWQSTTTKKPNYFRLKDEIKSTNKQE